MRLVKIVFGVTALALLLGLVMMIYLAAYLDRHKEVLEATVSTALGREVQIEGDIELAWSMTPSIAVRGLSVANADWASAPRLVHTDEAILQLRLLALLERRLEVRQLTLKGAQLHLEVSEDGLRNWQFGDAQDEGYDLRVERFEVDASQVSYRTPDGAQQRLEIGQLHLRGLGDDRLSLDGDLRYRDAAFVLSGELTADPDTGNATGPFSGELKTDGLALAFAGRTATPFALSDLQLTFTGDAKALVQTLSRMDLAVPAGASGKLTGEFRTQGASPAEWVDNLNGELALSAAEVVLPTRWPHLACLPSVPDLAGAEVELVAVTGRPLGWSDVIARQWPVRVALRELGQLRHARPDLQQRVVPRGGVWTDRSQLRVEVPAVSPWLSDGFTCSATGQTNGSADCRSAAGR